MTVYDNFEDFEAKKPTIADRIREKALENCITLINESNKDGFEAILLLKYGNMIDRGYSVRYKYVAPDDFELSSVTEYESEQEWLDGYNNLKKEVKNVVWV